MSAITRTASLAGCVNHDLKAGKRARKKEELLSNQLPSLAVHAADSSVAGDCWSSLFAHKSSTGARGSSSLARSSGSWRQMDARGCARGADAMPWEQGDRCDGRRAERRTSPGESERRRQAIASHSSRSSHSLSLTLASLLVKLQFTLTHTPALTRSSVQNTHSKNGCSGRRLASSIRRRRLR